MTGNTLSPQPIPLEQTIIIDKTPPLKYVDGSALNTMLCGSDFSFERIIRVEYVIIQFESQTPRCFASKESFLELEFSKPGDERTALAPCANSAPSEDYTNVFLSHVYVNVFAENFDVQPLKRLARSTLWPESVGDIVALARFV